MKNWPQESSSPLTNAPRDGHPKKVRGLPPNTPCYLALKALDALGSKPRQLAVFGNLATYAQIVEWKLARNGMPEWASDMLRAKLHERAESYCLLAGAIRAGRGYDWRRRERQTRAALTV